MLTCWRVTPVPRTAHPGARRVVLIRWAVREPVRGSESVTARSRHAKNNTPLKKKREWRASDALPGFLCRAGLHKAGVGGEQQPDEQHAGDAREKAKYPPLRKRGLPHPPLRQIPTSKDF